MRSKSWFFRWLVGFVLAEYILFFSLLLTGHPWTAFISFASWGLAWLTCVAFIGYDETKAKQ